MAKIKDRVSLTQRSIASLRKQFDRLTGKDGEPVEDATFWDADIRGFGLRIRKGGAATWVYQYQRGLTQGKVRLGDAAVVSAAVAEQRAKEERAKIDLGGDPQAERAEQRLKDKQTLRGVFDDYLRAKENAGLRPASLREIRRYLHTTFEPLHRIPAHRVLKRDIAKIIDTIAETRNERTGELKRSSASLALAHISTALNWAVEKDLIDDNPAANIKPLKRGERDRVLNDDELQRVWLACSDDSDPSRIIRLLILTGQRRDEISGMRERELDRRAKSWTLPIERSKNRRAHTLILPELAWQIIGRPRRAETIFGRSKDGFTGWQTAKKNLDQRCRLREPWVMHDLRRSVATGMATLGVQPHIIEAALNHASGHKGGIAGIYNRATYAREIRNALALWADHIASITQDTGRRIIPLREIPA